MSEISQLLLCFSKGSPIFITCQYFKSHSILSHSLTPFYLCPTPDQLSKKFYLIVSSLPFFSSFFFVLSLSFFPFFQPGLYSLFLLVSFPHSLKVTFLNCIYLIFSFQFSTIFLFMFHFIKFHSTVDETDPAMGFLQFCSHWSNTLSTLLQTS